MDNNILNLVKQYAGSAIINNPEVPADKDNTAIQSVSEGIMNGLKSEATGNGLGQILNMFKSSGGVSSSLTNSVQNSVIRSLTNKAGLSNSASSGIASSIVPMVLNSLSRLGKGNSSDGMNVQSILNSLTGGQTNGIDVQQLLNSNFGGDDGKFDLSDVKNMFGKGNGHQNNSSGNLINNIGNLFRK